MFTLVVQTFEGETVVLEHRFYGATRARAQEIYRAHMRTDAFLRGCTQQSRFGSIRCKSVVFWLDGGKPCACG